MADFPSYDQRTIFNKNNKRGNWSNKSSEEVKS